MWFSLLMLAGTSIVESDEVRPTLVQTAGIVPLRYATAFNQDGFHAELEGYQLGSMMVREDRVGMLVERWRFETDYRLRARVKTIAVAWVEMSRGDYASRNGVLPRGAEDIRAGVRFSLFDVPRPSSDDDGEPAPGFALPSADDLTLPTYRPLRPSADGE